MTVIRFPITQREIDELADVIEAHEGSAEGWTKLWLANIDHARGQARAIGLELTEPEAEAEAKAIEHAVTAELERRGWSGDDDGPLAA